MNKLYKEYRKQYPNLPPMDHSAGDLLFAIETIHTKLLKVKESDPHNLGEVIRCALMGKVCLDHWLDLMEVELNLQGSEVVVHPLNPKEH